MRDAGAGAGDGVEGNVGGRSVEREVKLAEKVGKGRKKYRAERKKKE